MALEMRLGRNGKLRPHWYGRYKVDNKRYAVNLKVKIAGNPPDSLKVKDLGDETFERSRFRAQLKLDEIIREARDSSDKIHLVEKIYEMKTGSALEFVDIKNLADAWENISRKRKPSERYAKQCRATLSNFSDYVIRKNPKARDISYVGRSLAEEFMRAEAARHVSAKTWNDILKLLRTTFQKLLPKGATNPFEHIPTRIVDTVFRQPFSPDELKAIIDELPHHEFIRPIIITGMCTAMRRGDCCLLKWEDVDMKEGFVRVKTSKTGVTVDIPLLPLLYDELAGLKQEGEYAFPGPAAMYKTNPDGITWRVKKVLTAALADDAQKEGALPERPLEDIRQKGHAYIKTLGETPKTKKMGTAFDLYLDGVSGTQIQEQAGVSKGSVSGYLNEIEAHIGCKVIKGRAQRSTTDKIKADEMLLSETREDGQRRASTRDFHSFRVTWVTLALSSGMPLEMVKKVTGHKTAEIVLKHYFKPGREELRRVLEEKMPRVVTHGSMRPALAEPSIEYSIDQSPGDELGKALEILEGVKSPKYTKQIKEAIRLIAGAKQWCDTSILRASD